MSAEKTTVTSPEMEAAAWTASNPIGTPVRFWPGAREGEGRLSRVRSQAWALGHGAVVVKVEGYSGGIALTHVEPIPEGSVSR